MMFDRNLRVSHVVVLAAALGCGGSSPSGDAQPGTDAILVPSGEDGGTLVDTGGITIGNGGIIGGTGAPAAGGTTGGGGVPGTGGVLLDAAIGTGGLISVDGGGAPGTGGNLATGGSTGMTCGEPGFLCCPGNTCSSGGCCVSGLCMSQGGACVRLGGGLCNAGACGSCGGPGLPCCSSETGMADACTAPSTWCNAGTCARCGDVGLACCASPTAGSPGVCNAPGTLCDSSNLCVPCGAPGTACCLGGQCASLGCCYEGTCVGESTACGTTAGICSAGRCSGCGAAAQPCCPSSTCYDGLLCKSGTCALCGAAGQACCASTSAADQCQTGMACTGPDGVCARCGGPGDICCAGNTCNGGCCSGGRCLVGDACAQDGGTQNDAPDDQCATGGAPCSALARFTGVQIVDGNDDEFCDVPAFELSFDNAGKTIENNTKGKSYAERAFARVAWDEAGLHAFVRVHDSSYTPAGSSASWNGDGIELMFSSSTAVTGLTYNDTNTLHVIVSPPVAQYSRDTASTGSQYALPTDQYRVGTDASGYFVELNLPWPGTPPTASAQIKFDLQLNIADGTTSTSDLYVRDAQAILYLGTASSTTCATTDIQPFCDDRLWCTTTLQP